jgi:hypothetical protein
MRQHDGGYHRHATDPVNQRQDVRRAGNGKILKHLASAIRGIQ